MEDEATASPTPRVVPGPAVGAAAGPVGGPAECAADVVRELETLSDVAIDQHVAAFELAHAKLRGLLTDEGHLSHGTRAVS